MAEKLLKLIIYYSKLEYMVNIQNSVALLYTKNKQVKLRIYFIGKYEIYMRKTTEPNRKNK